MLRSWPFNFPFQGVLAWMSYSDWFLEPWSGQFGTAPSWQHGTIQMWRIRLYW